MQYIFFADPEDGPSTELCAQLDLRGRFGDMQQPRHWPDLWHTLGSCADPVTVFLVMPQDDQHWPASRIRAEILKICEQAHAVVLCFTEIDILILHLRDLTRIANLWLMAPAQHNFGAGHRPMVIWQHWIQDLQLTWQPPVIQQRLANINRPPADACLFDVLLGGERPYRTLMHDLIESDADLRDQVVMSYYGGSGSRPRFITEPDMEQVAWPDPMHTGMRVQYHAVDMRVACIPPISIYQQTWFTVLAETSAHGFLNFYTEKVAKPLLAGRMFLVLGGQHYLQGLRDCGFQTFGTVIDESYDLEPDDNARVTMVFREMQRLSRCDPEKIWQQVTPMVQHNQELAWSQDFMCVSLHAVKQQLAQHGTLCRGQGK